MPEARPSTWGPSRGPGDPPRDELEVKSRRPLMYTPWMQQVLWLTYLFRRGATLGQGGATAGHDMHTAFRNGVWTVANMLGTEQYFQDLRTRPSPSPKVMMMMTKSGGLHCQPDSSDSSYCNLATAVAQPLRDNCWWRAGLEPIRAYQHDGKPATKVSMTTVFNAVAK